MTDYSITDPEVITFAEIVDDLPDNTVGSIGPTNVRAIYKSSIPRYFTLTVSNYTSGADPLWNGTTETAVVLPDQAANKRVVGNGFALDENGAIVYNGTPPMLVTLDFDAQFTCVQDTDVQIDLSHVNSLENVDEPLLTFTTTAAPTVPTTSGTTRRIFTVTAGSKIIITRTLSNADPDTSFTIQSWNFSLVAFPLVPATTEIRSGVYGTQNTQGALFSVLPFTILYPTADPLVDTPPTVDSGSYAFTPGAAGDNSMVVAASSTWVDTTSHIWFSVNSTAAIDANGIGSDGDFYALGEVTDSTVLVYGPKDNGYWPLYARSIPIGSLT